MKELINKYLGTLQISTKQTYKNLSMYPLICLEALMKKLMLLVLLLSCSGCGLLAANPGRYSYPYPEPHPCEYPCQQDDDGHIIYHTDHSDRK
jgi:hypothetical protein